MNKNGFSLMIIVMALAALSVVGVLGSYKYFTDQHLVSQQEKISKTKLCLSTLIYACKNDKPSKCKTFPNSCIPEDWTARSEDNSKLASNSGSLKICPSQWIKDSTFNQGGTKTYGEINGEKVKIENIDTTWVKNNCPPLKTDYIL